MKKIIAAGASALVSACLAACVSAPPTTPQVTAIDAGTLGLKGSAPAVVDKWWTALGDPQLDKLVTEGVGNSPTLAAALARLRLAQSEVSHERAATYPQLNIEAQDQRTRFSEKYIIPPPYGGTTQWYGTVQANLSWSLDLFGKQDAGLAKALASAQAASLDAEAARLVLAGAITQAYVGLARAYVLADVAQDALKQRQDISGLTARRQRNGLENAAASKIAEAQAAGAQIDLVRAEALKETAVHQIAALTGRGADAYAITRPQLQENALAPPETLPTDLLARRADIAAARTRIDAATAGRAQAERAFYPDINLVGSAGWAAIGLSPLFTASALQYGAGPAIHLPIFDAGELRAHFAGATAMLDEAVADYNNTVIGAVRQTADAVSDLKSLEGQRTELVHMREAADASFDLAQRRYKSGLSPQLTVLDAEDIVLSARRQDAALSTDILAARVSLLMALGGGFTSSPAKDNAHE